MNRRAIEGALGRLCWVCAIALLLPLGVSFLEPGPAPWLERGVFAGAMAGAAILGGLLIRLGRGADEADLGPREGYVIVTVGWLLFTVIGAVPFIFVSGLRPVDAWFETMSGFTTTGASILDGDGIEGLSDAVAVWRSVSQWLGGLGIVVLSVAVLPALGTRGSSLVRSEFSGHSHRIRPRIASTARLLWLFYCGMTLAAIATYWLCGMSLHDAVCHAFTTLATGGFSTKGASIAGFDSAAIDWAVTFFMFFSGVNFALLYAVFVQRRWKRGATDEEFRFYLAATLIGTAAIAAVLWSSGLGAHDGLRHAAFQTVSIITTTGFGTHDYTTWLPAGQVLILTFFFFGGCVGSTGGSVKIARVLVTLKVAWREVKQMLRPRAVIPLRFNDQALERDTVNAAVTYVVVYVLAVGVGTLWIAVWGSDLWVAFSASASCVGNIGPGFGPVGPAGHYGGLSDPAKWGCGVLMLAGRLEIYSLLLLVLPATWKR